jgi:hypothetical protein
VPKWRNARGDAPTRPALRSRQDVGTVREQEAGVEDLDVRRRGIDRLSPLGLDCIDERAVGASGGVAIAGGIGCTVPTSVKMPSSSSY